MNHPLKVCPQKQLSTVYGITAHRSTLWRWEFVDLSFPPRIIRGGRIYYYCIQIEAWLRDAQSWKTVLVREITL